VTPACNHRQRRPVGRARGAEPGFTLIEAMIVVAIVATLATIAVPGYAAYVQRGRILEAVARLADASARMQEYFLDERTYLDASGACAIASGTGTSADAFTLTCTATASTFVYTATGRTDKGMSAFVYAIDESGAKKTVSLPAGWSRSGDCWTIRADGLCA
jgi:type IV pilus assembly protein PilE